MAASYRQRKAIGDYGERLACRCLVAAGLVVLDRNWRCDEGELDLVAADGGLIVVCEVKTRTSDRFGTPFESITPSKAARLTRLGWRWIREHDVRASGMRVDVVAIRLPRREQPVVEHLPGVA